MTTRGEHTEWHELVAAQALHALDAGEEARLRDHLAGCEDCRAELDVHTLTAAHLASLADDSDTAPPAWSAIRAGVVGEANSQDVVRLDDRRRPPWLLGAAAAVVLLTGGAVAGWQVVQSQNGSGSGPAAIQLCGGAKGCEQIDLRSSDGVRRASVIVSNGTALVQPISLHAPASGRTFVLWQLPRSGAPIPLGEFASTSTTSSADKLAVSMSQTTAFAVSSERSDVPPSKPTQVLALGGATS